MPCNSGNRGTKDRLFMRDLQARATLNNPRLHTRDEVLGQRFESARRLTILSRFAGKTSSDVKTPALRWGRFTATRLPQSTHHSACRLIFDSRRYLAPLRGNGAITTGWATWNRRSNPGAPRVDQLRIPLCPETRCSRRDYHLRASCWPRS